MGQPGPTVRDWPTKLLFSLHLCFSCLSVTVSWFMFFVLQKSPKVSTLSIPSALLSFESSTVLSKACKRRSTERQWCKNQPFTEARRQRTELKSLCNLCCCASSCSEIQREGLSRVELFIFPLRRALWSPCPLLLITVFFVWNESETVREATDGRSHTFLGVK